MEGEPGTPAGLPTSARATVRVQCPAGAFRFDFGRVAPNSYHVYQGEAMAGGYWLGALLSNGRWEPGPGRWQREKRIAGRVIRVLQGEPAPGWVVEVEGW